MREGYRADRRHHARRLKVNRRGYWGGKDKSHVAIGKLVNTAALCSCWMCCNPRHVFKEGMTIQERRWHQDVGD
jgi:hypothetical protein